MIEGFLLGVRLSEALMIRIDSQFRRFRMLGAVCPKCGSTQTQWRRKPAHGLGLGSLAGAALGSSGPLAGTEAGAAMGIAGGPAGMLLGGVAGAVLGALLGSSCGQQSLTESYQCQHCGHVFSPLD
jgi:predicted RNA-binding Zn-ribbon protein involved in translation (DUF1610 family)